MKVFAFPLFKPIGKPGQGSTQRVGIDQPVNTASFIPFGRDYRGGVSLAAGWLAGSLGGAKRIIVGQLADRGSVKIFSTGSALDGGPSLYLQSPLHHGHSAHFREIASFEPFDGSAGTRVATTSTTTGAHLWHGRPVAAFAWYRRQPTGNLLSPVYERSGADARWAAHSIHVLTLEHDIISTLTPFVPPLGPRLFHAFGLPLVIRRPRGPNRGSTPRH